MSSRSKQSRITAPPHQQGQGQLGQPKKKKIPTDYYESTFHALPEFLVAGWVTFALLPTAYEKQGTFIQLVTKKPMSDKHQAGRNASIKIQMGSPSGEHVSYPFGCSGMADEKTGETKYGIPVRLNRSAGRYDDDAVFSDALYQTQLKIDQWVLKELETNYTAFGLESLDSKTRNIMFNTLFRKQSENHKPATMAQSEWEGVKNIYDPRLSIKVRDAKVGDLPKLSHIGKIRLDKVPPKMYMAPLEERISDIRQIPPRATGWIQYYWGKMWQNGNTFGIQCDLAHVWFLSPSPIQVDKVVDGVVLEEADSSEEEDGGYKLSKVAPLLLEPAPTAKSTSVMMYPPKASSDGGAGTKRKHNSTSSTEENSEGEDEHDERSKKKPKSAVSFLPATVKKITKTKKAPTPSGSEEEEEEEVKPKDIPKKGKKAAPVADDINSEIEDEGDQPLAPITPNAQRQAKKIPTPPKPKKAKSTKRTGAGDEDEDGFISEKEEDGNDSAPGSGD